nr:glycosyltransferase family A protein [Zhihengliuella flava]
MYANRAIELQASGTVVISNYNLGLNSRFPHVHLANSAADVAGFIDSLTFDQQRTIQVRGIRDAFGSNLSLYGLDRILSTVGLSTPDRTLRAIAVADHADDRLRSQFAKQSIGPVEVVAPEHLERAANAAQANVVLDVTSHRDYGVNYALDHLNAYKYASTQQAGKLDGPAEAADARAHQYVDGTPAAGLGSRWVSADSADTHECSQSDYYGIDHFGSWPRGVRTVTVTAAHHAERPLLSVVVPIYNNGQHLKYKCIQSLRRSSLFEQMEIILVDDGSTDGATPATVKELAAQLPRAVHYRFRDGGSGSASRPRNKGLELATGEFVTYLDPDNEATEDGFAHLVELLRAHPEAEIAAGNMSRWSDSYRVSNNVAYLRQATGGAGEFVAVPQATLAKLKFRPVSIQALVARTDWLRDLHLVQPVGAAGQDSYFFQQVLFHTEKMALSDRVIHTYYAAVEDSTVNTVGARFFEKYLLLEIPRVAWLHEVGLFDAYAETRLEQYVRDWYLNKLDAVKPAERSDAVATLAKILALYADHQWREPRIRAFLAEHGV